MDKAMREALLKILQNEADVDELLNTSRGVNQVVEDNDLMRRAAVAKGQTANYREVNTTKEGTPHLMATDRFVSGVANQVFTSEAWVDIKERVAKLESYDKRIMELERDNAQLRARVIELERADEEKVTERINSMPANNSFVIDLPSDSFSLTQPAHRAQVHNDPEQYKYSQALSSLSAMTALLKKDGGK